MTKLQSWKTIAKDLDKREGYLLRRVLIAEGKDPDDSAALRELLMDVQAAEPYTRA